jgi:hypothetical protein
MAAPLISKITPKPTNPEIASPSAPPPTLPKSTMAYSNIVECKQSEMACTTIIPIAGGRTLSNAICRAWISKTYSGCLTGAIYGFVEAAALVCEYALSENGFDAFDGAAALGNGDAAPMVGGGVNGGGPDANGEAGGKLAGVFDVVPVAGRAACMTS